MFLQNCKELKNFTIDGKHYFKDHGCAICSALLIVEQRTRRFFDPRFLMVESYHWKNVGIIDNEFYVNSWIRLFKVLGVNVKVRFEGPDYICKENEEEILNLVRPNHQHFTAGDGRGNYSYDSLGRRPEQALYRIKDKRIISF